MKKITLSLFAAMAALTTYAKDILPEQVPATVRSYVTKHYPKANYVEWDDKSKKGYYEAEFKIDGREVELDISTNGTLLKSKEDILIKDIPANIVQYINQNYKDAQILGANKRVQNQSTSYSVGVRFTNNQGYERHRNIIFDSNGNVIKK